MRKLKIVGVLWLSLLIVFLYLDYRGYYYGFGFGIFNKKIPKIFSVLYAGSDLGNQGIIIEQNEMGIYHIQGNSDYSIRTTNKEKMIWIKESQEIFVKKIKGYWFNHKVLVAKVLDKNDKERYIMTYEESTNRLHPDIICEEMKHPPSEYDNLTYIDLDKSLTYFGRFRAVKNLVFILLLFLSVYVTIKAILRTSLFNSKINYN